MDDQDTPSLLGLSLIAELELRQDRVLRELDELNRRIEAVLEDYAPVKAVSSGGLAFSMTAVPESVMPTSVGLS